MAPIIKSQAEREKIRETGHIVAQVLAELRAAVRPGITTIELDRLAVEALKQRLACRLGYYRSGRNGFARSAASTEGNRGRTLSRYCSCSCRQSSKRYQPRGTGVRRGGRIFGGTPVWWAWCRS